MKPRSLEGAWLRRSLHNSATCASGATLPGQLAAAKYR